VKAAEPWVVGAAVAGDEDFEAINAYLRTLAH
jgi:hypothetical protein